MSKVIMGNDGFYRCLSEPQGVSAWWKETAETLFVFSSSLLLNHLEPISSKAKLLLPIMPIGIVAYAFTLSWDNLCRNSCILIADIRDFITLFYVIFRGTQRETSMKYLFGRVYSFG